MNFHSIYALKWIKEYLLKRSAFVLLTIIISIISLSYFNIQMSREIQSPLHVLSKIQNTNYVYLGYTNHDNYTGDNFYQQLNDGFFYSREETDGLSGKIDAIAIRKLPNRTYTEDISPLEQYHLLEGNFPSSPTEVVLSKNTALRYDLNIGDEIFYFSSESPKTSPFVVSGIVESFYGLHKIDTSIDSGLILLHETSCIHSSCYFQFFEKSNDATYSDLFVKYQDIAVLEEKIQSTTTYYGALSLIFGFILVFVFHLKIKKYIARLKHENCSAFDIFLFILGLFASILIIIFMAVTLSVVCFCGIHWTSGFTILMEFLILLISLTFLFSILFLPRRFSK